MSIPTILKVRDKLATERPREHEIINEHGELVRHVFRPGQWVEMPYAEAMRFLPTTEGFEVRALDNTPIRPKAAEGRRYLGSGVALRIDEVIARLDELSREALYARAKEQGGSETVEGSWSRAKLIEFLLIGVASDDGDVGVKAPPSNSEAGAGLGIPDAPAVAKVAA